MSAYDRQSQLWGCLICWIQARDRGEKELGGEEQEGSQNQRRYCCNYFPIRNISAPCFGNLTLDLYHTALILVRQSSSLDECQTCLKPQEAQTEDERDAASYGLITADVKSSPAHIIRNHRSRYPFPLPSYIRFLFDLMGAFLRRERGSHSPDTNLKRQSKVINSQTGDCKLNYWDGEPGGGRDQQWEPVSHLSISKAFRAGEGAVSFWIVARDQRWLKLTWA